MLPTIHIGTFSVPTFTLCAIAGVIALVLTVLARVNSLERPSYETAYILPKLFISLSVGFVGAVIFDALFKIPQNGGFKISGITFYGGAVTGIAALAVLISAMRKNTRLSTIAWLDLLTVPFLCFHFLGRIGCFLGGCCYGKATTGPFGLVFPDLPEQNIFHYGQAVYPTQLYEAAAIGIIIIVLILVKKRNFCIYCFAYPIARFFIEFLRGDNRGNYLLGLSPAQLISCIIVGTTLVITLIRLIMSHRNNRMVSGLFLMFLLIKYIALRIGNFFCAIGRLVKNFFVKTGSIIAILFAAIFSFFKSLFRRDKS